MPLAANFNHAAGDFFPVRVLIVRLRREFINGGHRHTTPSGSRPFAGSLQAHADGPVTKGGPTLGVIPFGSAIVYSIAGYFESL